jgi:hypothetical protein
MYKQIIMYILHSRVSLSIVALNVYSAGLIRSYERKKRLNNPRRGGTIWVASYRTPGVICDAFDISIQVLRISEFYTELLRHVNCVNDL